MDEWNTKICIIDMRDDLQPEISGWLFQSQLAGAVVRRPHYRPDSLLVFVSVQFLNIQKGTRQSTYLRQWYNKTM